MDMTDFYDIDGYCMLAKKLDTSVPSLTAVFRPFQVNVWLAILSSWMCYLLFLFSWKRLLTSRRGQADDDVLLHAIAVLLSNSFRCRPR